MFNVFVCNVCNVFQCPTCITATIKGHKFTWNIIKLGNWIFDQSYEKQVQSYWDVKRSVIHPIDTGKL